MKLKWIKLIKDEEKLVLNIPVLLNGEIEINQIFIPKKILNNNNIIEEKFLNNNNEDASPVLKEFSIPIVNIFEANDNNNEFFLTFRITEAVLITFETTKKKWKHSVYDK